MKRGWETGGMESYISDGVIRETTSLRRGCLNKDMKEEAMQTPEGEGIASCKCPEGLTCSGSWDEPLIAGAE